MTNADNNSGKNAWDDSLWGPDPESTDGTSTPKRKLGGKAWVGVGVGALALTGAAAVGINAAGAKTTSIGGTTATAGAGGMTGAMGGGPGGQGGRGTSGTIATTGSSLRITTSAGKTVLVTTTDTTKVSVSAAATVATIKAGDHITVLGATSGTTVTADLIIDTGTDATVAMGGGGMGGPPGVAGAAPAGAGPGMGGGAPVSGTVTSNDGTKLVLTVADGTTKTVTTAATTTVTTQATKTIADLAVGERVTVNGTTAADGSIAATAIRVTPSTAG